MSTKHFILAIISCNAVIAPVTRAEPLERTGEHFQLVCHSEIEKIADEAIKTLDATWPVVATSFKVEDKPASTRPTVHLYVNTTDYEKSEKELAGGKFRDNLAFTHYESNSAHVVLQPPCSEEVLKSVGLPGLTRRLLAHEAVHLTGHSLVDQYETLPQWIIDGAATSIDQSVMEKLGASESRESDPYCSTYMQHAKDLRKNGKLPAIADIMKGTLDEMDPLDRYGLRWLCYEFIHKGVGEEKWGTAIKQSVKKPRAMWKYYVITSFLNSGKPVDERFGKYINKLKPQWDQLYRSLEPDGTNWRQLAFPEKNALCWKTVGIKEKKFEISGQAKIFPGSAQQLNLLLSRSDEGFISIAMVSDYGVTVLQYKSKTEEWSTIGDAKCDGLKPGKTFKFTARYEDGKLEVSIDHRRVVTVPVEPALVTGPWGLGAQGGTAGIWSKLVCRTGKAVPKKIADD